MLELVANCILLHIHQLVLVSLRFVGLPLVESPDCVRLVITDIICADLNMLIVSLIALSRCIVETFFIDIGIQPVDLPNFHDSGAALSSSMFIRLCQSIFLLLLLLFTIMYSTGSGNLASEP